MVETDAHALSCSPEHIGVRRLHRLAWFGMSVRQMRKHWIVAGIIGLVVLFGDLARWDWDWDWDWENSTIYTHRYRLTISFVSDEQTRSASSVIEVRYEIWPFSKMMQLGRRYDVSVVGQAPLIDLGAHGALLGSLVNVSAPHALGADRIALHALGPRPRMPGEGLMSTPEGPLETLTLRGRADLRPDNLPQLIWLRDIADPTTAQPVWLWDLPLMTGKLGEVQFLSAQVEITADPIVIDIDSKIPWLHTLPPAHAPWPPDGTQPKFQLSSDMFVQRPK
jgi:hypothetical protein